MLNFGSQLVIFKRKMQYVTEEQIIQHIIKIMLQLLVSVQHAEVRLNDKNQLNFSTAITKVRRAKFLIIKTMFKRHKRRILD